MPRIQTLYKLVDEGGYSRRDQPGETLWLPVGRTVRPTGKGTRPCGPGVLHFYASPIEAVLYNEVHAAIPAPQCLRVTVDGRVSSDGLMLWGRGPATVLGTEELPTISMIERIAWAICIAPCPATRDWAIAWLTDHDRTCRAAGLAARAAWAEARAAWPAAGAAVLAARLAEPSPRRRAAALERRAAREAALAAQNATHARRAAFEFRARSLAALARARAILAGELPAEQYDERGRR